MSETAVPTSIPVVRAGSGRSLSRLRRLAATRSSGWSILLQWQNLLRQEAQEAPVTQVVSQCSRNCPNCARIADPSHPCNIW